MSFRKEPEFSLRGLWGLEESGFNYRKVTMPEGTAGQIPRVAALPSG